MILWKILVTAQTAGLAYFYWRLRQSEKTILRLAQLTERLSKATEGLQTQQLQFMKCVYGRWDEEDKCLTSDTANAATSPAAAPLAEIPSLAGTPQPESAVSSK